MKPRLIQWFAVVASSGSPAWVAALPPNVRTVFATSSSAPASQGPTLFANSGCTHCHGSAGQGTEKGPSLHDVRTHSTAEQIHRQIKEGGQSMPEFGDSLGPEQMDSLVKLLRSKAWWKQLPPSADPRGSPGPLPR